MSSLVWLPQSANCGGTSMGYDDLYWFPGHYNSSFGTEAQLRSLISTFKAKGIGTIADVVINHRKNVSSWVDFPKETYKGVTYEMKSTDICANDDGGKTKTWASQNGYSLSTNNDTGEGWDGMRDLDHKSENVQTIVKAYLDFLLNDLGYTGFRYDMVKGYTISCGGFYGPQGRVLDLSVDRIPVGCDGVDLVYEDDAGGVLLGLLEDLPQTLLALPVELTHDFRTLDGVERSA